MKIRKFNESEIQNLSNERTDEIINTLTEFKSNINQKNEIDFHVGIVCNSTTKSCLF